MGSSHPSRRNARLLQTSSGQTMRTGRWTHSGWRPLARLRAQRTAGMPKWTDYEDREVDTLGMETTCEVKSATDCRDAQVNKCSHVEWNECKMVPFEECDNVFVYQPDQEKIHKQSCLENNF